MTGARVLQEVRQMRFEELFARRQQRILTMAEAAEMPGVTERTFRRWGVRYDAEGVEGLQDRRLGRPSGRAVPVDDALRMVTLYETRYRGWTVKHIYERWQTEHGGRRSYSLQEDPAGRGYLARAPRRGAHRKKRPRKPLPGMRLHQDGSTHEWMPGCQWDVVVTLDDATTEIYSAFLVEGEGALSSFRGLREVMETKGRFCSLYTDRGSYDWLTEEAGGKVDKTRLTQVHRTLQQVGITLIPAYSPEARGRSERAFLTLQDRLPTVSGQAVSPHLQPALCGVGLRSRDGLRPLEWDRPRRSALCPRSARRRQGQHRTVSGHEPADPTGPYLQPYQGGNSSPDHRSFAAT